MSYQSQSDYFVYFIRAETGEIKIGVAANPMNRLASLQTGSPARLSLYATLPGGVNRERDLHRMFAAHRLHGEWFAGDILPDIDALLQADESHTLCSRCHAPKPVEAFEESSPSCRECSEAAYADVQVRLDIMEETEKERRHHEWRVENLNRLLVQKAHEVSDAVDALSGYERERLKDALGEDSAERLETLLAEVAERRAVEERRVNDLLAELPRV